MLPERKLKNLRRDYKSRSESSILKEAKKLLYKLVVDTYETVPAYHEFLQRSLNSKKISRKVLKDSKNLPPTDKQNYLRQFDRARLASSFMNKAWIFSTTSGSTGEPFYFPRLAYHDRIYAASAEAYLLENFQIDKKSTLYIVAFPMGAWIGGVFTFSAISKVAERGYPLSVITPGINKLEVIKSVKNLAKEFDQIIIGSYAPFLKDILDDGEAEGIDWKKLNVKFIFSAEAFSEEFRDFLKDKTRLNDILKDTLNHYGTVDLGTMAHETPYSILARRLAYQNKALFQSIFGDIAKTPTLAQFDPRLFYFEEEDGNLYCSSNSGYPLIRYDLKDRGGVISKKDLESKFKTAGIDLPREARKAGIADTVWNLPFVFVYERSDLSVSYYAFQVYPEPIRKALLDNRVESYLTGKCTMQVLYKGGRQVLNIFVEKRPNKNLDETVEAKIGDVIHQVLLRENSEYRKTAEELGETTVRPRVKVREYEDAEYFRPGGKQKWVKK